MPRGGVPVRQSSAPSKKDVRQECTIESIVGPLVREIKLWLRRDMPVYETFSRRRDLAAKAGQPEIYVYDELPDQLINQIIMIWSDAVPT